MIMAGYKSDAGSLPCYTFGGMFRDCRDVTVARRVARVCRQPHRVIPVGKEFLQRFSHYAERSVFLSDGLVDVSRSPDLYLQEKARQIAPVRIAGTYGSEVLRGLGGFKPRNPAPGLFCRELLTQFDRAQTTYGELRKLHPVSFAVFQPSPQRGVDVLEHTQLAVRSPYLDNNLVKTAFRAPQSTFARSDIFADNDACSRLIADGHPRLGRIRTDRGLTGPRGPWSAVVRSYLEFTFKAEYAYDYGMPQWLARTDHFFSALHLERFFLGRHKLFHFRIWYRDYIADYLRQMLLDERALSRSYIERRGLEAVVQGHVRGDRNYTTEIHKLLALELVHRFFVDAK